MEIELLTGARPMDRWEAYAKYRLTLDREAAQSGAADATRETPASKRVNDTQGCETCKDRKYQDGSADPGVSFKTPTRISADQAAAAVRGHEQEHVTRERGKAAREGREVVSQSVTYHTAICPECGQNYTSGGTTRTVTRGVSQPEPTRPQPEQGFEAYA